MFFMMLHFVRALGDDDLKQEERITRTATDFTYVYLIKMLSEGIKTSAVRPSNISCRKRFPNACKALKH
jgi:hypothetical protein